MIDPIEPQNPHEDIDSVLQPEDEVPGRSFASRASGAFSGKRTAILCIGAFALIALIVFFVNSGTKTPSQVRLSTTPNIPSTQAAKPLSAAYAADVQADNAQRAAAAAADGGSAIATPVMPAPPPVPTQATPAPVGTPPEVEFSPSPTEDGTTDAIQGAVAPASAQSGGVQAGAQPAVMPNAAFNKPDSDAMLEAMRGLIKAPGEEATQVATDLQAPGDDTASTTTAETDGTKDFANASAGQMNESVSSDGSVSDHDAAKAKALVPAAGTILYARMIGELNSDAPGAALATIVAGPLAGARVIGGFQAARAGLIIKFSLMTVPASDESGTITTPINAEAVSADNLTSRMATSINNHLISNLGVTFVAGFAQGFGQALSQSGSSTTLSGTGLEAITNPTLTLPEELASAGGTAAGAVGGEFQQLYGNRPPTIKLAANTPFALLFLGANDGVTDAQSQLQTVQDQSGNSSSTSSPAAGGGADSIKFSPTLPARGTFGTVTNLPGGESSPGYSYPSQNLNQ